MSRLKKEHGFKVTSRDFFKTSVDFSQLFNVSHDSLKRHVFFCHDS